MLVSIEVGLTVSLNIVTLAQLTEFDSDYDRIENKCKINTYSTEITITPNFRDNSLVIESTKSEKIYIISYKKPRLICEID